MLFGLTKHFHSCFSTLKSKHMLPFLLTGEARKTERPLSRLIFVPCNKVSGAKTKAIAAFLLCYLTDSTPSLRAWKNQCG